MADNRFYTYKHIRNDSGEVFYVGKGGHDEQGKYKRSRTTTRRNEIWNRIVKKTGYSIEIHTDNMCENDAFAEEVSLIEYYGRINDKSNKGTLCNMTNGGEGLSGYTHLVSNETRKKISLTMTGRKYSKERIENTAQANKGRKLSKEHCEKISKANKGRVFSRETRKKLSDARKGTHLSDETKNKLSIINKGKKLSKERIDKMKGRLSNDKQKAALDRGRREHREKIIKSVIDDITGVVYETLSSAAKANNLTSQTLSRYLRGDRKNKTTMRYL